MKKYTWENFINKFNQVKLADKIDARLSKLEENAIEHELFHNSPFLDLTHFFEVILSKGQDPLFFAAECVYTCKTPFGIDANLTVMRHIITIRLFEDELDYEFYKVVMEMGNPDYMEPVLFN
jgi:hypothetical protein